MTYQVPPHVVGHWREKWGLSDKQIERLQRRFVNDWRQRVKQADHIEPEQERDKPKRRPRPSGTPERVLEMAEMNKAKSQTEIAKHFSITPQAVSWLFKRYGIKTISHPRRKKFDVQAAYQHYEKTKSLVATARAFEVDTNNLSLTFREAGLSTRLGVPQRRTTGKLPDIDAMIELLKTHTPQGVADKYGVRRVTVYAKFKRLGKSVKDYR